jgi:hypothetical protein
MLTSGGGGSLPRGWRGNPSHGVPSLAISKNPVYNICPRKRRQITVHVIQICNCFNKKKANEWYCCGKDEQYVEFAAGPLKIDKHIKRRALDTALLNYSVFKTAHIILLSLAHAFYYVKLQLVNNAQSSHLL